MVTVWSLRLLRLFWKGIFVLFAFGVGVWTTKNLSHITGDLTYFLPKISTLVLLTAVLYLFAFRTSSELFLNLNLLIFTMTLVAVIAELGVRIWELKLIRLENEARRTAARHAESSGF